ncbi:hypothetical protein BVH01_22875 [Pseudomonas sp. PA1(2017)]|uniref:LasR-specific antiactivator QslA n=1 Tax=Pseudomonas sp. PA1(2017) TaxID=1932113 RepID=UPI000964CBD8|nr:hypothetical protein BVH01_22875 [Pseudomonas sp. PA1(2017)]
MLVDRQYLLQPIRLPINATERWLDGKRTHWLWAALIFERDVVSHETDRKGVEMGFISRIQRRFFWGELCNLFAAYLPLRK